VYSFFPVTLLKPSSDLLYWKLSDFVWFCFQYSPKIFNHTYVWWLRWSFNCFWAVVQAPLSYHTWRMFWDIVMVNCTMNLNPKCLSIALQMFSKNVYINVFVHDAFDKMKTSHSFDAAMHTHTIKVPLSHLTAGRRIFFFRSPSPGFLHTYISLSYPYTLYLLVSTNKIFFQNSENFCT
jgi:hypothetical protein